MSNSLNLSKIDNHVHVKVHQPGAPLRIRETIEAAIEVGLTSITITDHLTFPKAFEDPTAFKTDSLTETEFDGLAKEVQELKRCYQERIEVLFGAEADWLPNHHQEIEERLRRYKFDLVIGSIHFLGTYKNYDMVTNLGIDNNLELLKKGIEAYGDIQTLVEKYYEYIQQMVVSGLFDSCGHLDLIKKFNVSDSLFCAESDWYQKVVRETLGVIAESGMGIEINTAGKRKPCGEFYPAGWILQEAGKLGIPLTLGADAHVPELVGNNIDEAIKYASDAGYQEICKYVNRKRVMIRI